VEELTEVNKKILERTNSKDTQKKWTEKDKERSLKNFPHCEGTFFWSAKMVPPFYLLY